jgi:hypothetical protein
MINTSPLDDTDKEHPIDTLLFGQMGAVAAQLCQDLSKGFPGRQFMFMDESEFAIAQAGSMAVT